MAPRPDGPSTRRRLDQTARTGQTGRVSDPLVPIGVFARMTFLTVKTLRHYHAVGLLAPVRIDEHSGYRYYSADQVPTAQTIRRLREAEMSLEEIGHVMADGDPVARARRLTEHLRELESRLTRTRDAVAEVGRWLDVETAEVAGRVEIVLAPAQRVLAVRGRVAMPTVEGWLVPALGRLHRAAEDSRLEPAGDDGALYSDGFYADGEGAVTAYLPVADGGSFTPADDVVELILPPTRYARIDHRGPFSGLDAAYAALGTWVVRAGTGASGPIRETYPGDGRALIDWPLVASSP